MSVANSSHSLVRRIFEAVGLVRLVGSFIGAPVGAVPAPHLVLALPTVPAAWSVGGGSLGASCPRRALDAGSDSTSGRLVGSTAERQAKRGRRLLLPREDMFDDAVPEPMAEPEAEKPATEGEQPAVRGGGGLKP